MENEKINNSNKMFKIVSINIFKYQNEALLKLVKLGIETSRSNCIRLALRKMIHDEIEMSKVLNKYYFDNDMTILKEDKTKPLTAYVNIIYLKYVEEKVRLSYFSNKSQVFRKCINDYLISENIFLQDINKLKTLTNSVTTTKRNKIF